MEKAKRHGTTVSMDVGWDDSLKWDMGVLVSYMSVETDKKGTDKDNNETIDTEGYAGVVLDYLTAKRGGGKREIVVSVPAGENEYGLRPADVMETTCSADKSGLLPRREGHLRESAAVLMKTIKEYERLTVSAAIAGDKACAVEALTIHPLVQSYKKATAIVEELNTAYPYIF